MTVEIYGNSGWVDITSWIAWQGLTFSRNDIDAPNAGRDMAGFMHRGRVAKKEKMQIQTIPLGKANISTLMRLIEPESFSVRVTPYPETNAEHVMTMYTNNVTTSHVIHKDVWKGVENEDLQIVKFPLIEL